MRLSLVIPSRNRSGQLARSLEALNLAAMARLGVDLVLVDSASTDDTRAVMERFAAAAGLNAQVLSAPRPGASLARNLGVRAARGDTVIFTDDDCYLDPGYFDVVAQTFDAARFQYAGGQTLLHDPADAPIGLTQFNFEGVRLIEPGLMLRPGLVQSANLIFDRAAFERAGGYDERLGAGTRFHCEDVELCTRASIQGCVGAYISEALVRHHHGRKAQSPEAVVANADYVRGRGAYYALMMMRGVKGAWTLWGDNMALDVLGGAASLRLEMEGAAEYLAMLGNRAVVTPLSPDAPAHRS